MTLREKIALFCVRLATICLVAGVLIALPEPDSVDFVRMKNALIALLAVISLGVVLFDTFFYDRYNR